MDTEDITRAARELRRQTVSRDSSRSPLRSAIVSDPDSESSRASSTSRGRAMSRGRGRGAGLSRAKATLREAKDEAKEVAFNQILRDRVSRSKVPEFILEPSEIATEVTNRDFSNINVEELRAAAGKNVALIIQATSKVGKGNTKQIKEAAASLQELVDALAARSVDEELRRVRADNGRLRQEIENLRVELKAHRREFSDMKTTAASAKTANTLSGDVLEELKAAIVSSVGVMLDARFAGIEERLLPEKIHRPPLAADKRRLTRTSSKSTTGLQTVQSESLPAQISKETAEPVAGHSQVDAPGVADWATVVKKGKKGKKSTAGTTNTTAPAGKITRPTKPTLMSPKTSAVTITLQPEAAERGVTYAQILEQAEQRVNLQELGIAEGIKMRRAATGARLLELPKGQTPEQADLLASKLRMALEGIANVVRPTKSASIRINGLDDSVTKEKVVTAVARAGNCPVQSIKATEVMPGPRGMGSATVHCPMEVAKLLSEAGRLLVGWSSAEVRVLDQRPLRCFRCLSIGHTRPVCPSAVDRGELCFRCGCDGHKSFGCTASLRCAVCADAGIPSDHIMAGKNCSPPLTKGRPFLLVQTTPSAGPRQTQEEADMSS